MVGSKFHMPPGASPKPSTSELLPGVEVFLSRKAPRVAFEVVVLSPEGSEPTDLYAGLRAIGFNPQPSTVAAEDGVRRSFGRQGSAMFGDWTQPERERFIGEARRTLRRFGFASVPEIRDSTNSPTAR
jgi:hypothetical protein